MIYFKTLALALALFVFLRSVSALHYMVTNNKKFRFLFLRLFPVVEIIIWIAFSFWALNYLFRETELYLLITASTIILLISVSGWYLFRDFFSGIILKSENAFEPGQKIQTDVASGIIRKLGSRSMEIETKEGELVKIPYTLLSSVKLIKPADYEKGVGYVIRLNISSRYPAVNIKNLLEKRILEMPWIISGEGINVLLNKKDKEHYIAEIQFHSLSQETALKTEENMQDFVAKVFP